MRTPRQNMLAALRGETPDRLTVCAWIDSYNQPARHDMPGELAELLGPANALHPEAVWRFSRWLGLAVMDRVDSPVRTIRHRVTREVKKSGNETTITWQTPAGELSEVIRSEPQLRTSSRSRHLVGQPADLARLAAIFEDETYELDPAALAEIRRRRELVGEDGILLLFMPGTPLGMMVRVFTSVEDLAYLWLDAPAALADLFAVMERAYRRQFELAIQADVDALVTMDDTSTTTISPAMFERCNLQVTHDRAVLVQQAGKLYFHHSCGLIRDLLALYRQTPLDAVHFFTPPTMGNVTVAEGLRALRTDQALIPLVPQIFGPMDDQEAVRRSMQQWKAELGDGARVVPALIPDPAKGMADTRLIAKLLGATQ